MNAHEEFYANLFSRDEIDPNIQSDLLSILLRLFQIMIAIVAKVNSLLLNLRMH